MDKCDAMFSATHLLAEQIARQVFEVLPERGPIVIIIDRDGNCWPSNAEEFAKLNVNETILKELRTKVDDGAEPVITQVGETSVIVAQLSTDRTHCGYVAVVLPRYSPESTLANIDLVEAMLNQVTLIARLIEKSSMLTGSPVNHYAAVHPSGPALN
jgi:hypothetical protein